jgi:hypothetical protein
VLTLFTCFTSTKVLALLVQKYLLRGRANRRHEKGREKEKKREVCLLALLVQKCLLSAAATKREERKKKGEVCLLALLVQKGLLYRSRHEKGRKKEKRRSRRRHLGGTTLAEGRIH